MCSASESSSDDSSDVVTSSAGVSIHRLNDDEGLTFRFAM